MKIYQIKGGRVQNKYIKIQKHENENDNKLVSENIPIQIEVPKNNEIKIPEKKVRKFISL